MKEYKVIEEVGISNLMKSVNELLKQGWDCQGGVDAAPSDSIAFYTQAMVREIKAE